MNAQYALAFCFIGSCFVLIGILLFSAVACRQRRNDKMAIFFVVVAIIVAAGLIGCLMTAMENGI